MHGWKCTVSTYYFSTVHDHFTVTSVTHAHEYSTYQ